MNTIAKLPTRLAPGPPAAPGAGPLVARLFVLVVMFGACAFFWVGIPVGGLYLLGELLDSATTHLVAGLLGVPLLMVLFAPFLFWLNGLYLRVSGVLARIEADEEKFGWSRRVSGPLEPMLVASFVVAIVALFVWFFVFAHNPSAQVI